ncbi:MAG: S1 RNA-binding domain-containing protein [Anaerolineae bacterium]|nr:S1 RNA-binding domain-containing protein [Anaerolineae bacterium]
MNSNGQELEETEVTNAASGNEPAQPEVESVSSQAETAPPQAEAASADVPSATVEASSEGTDASSEGAGEPIPAEGDWLAQDTSDQKGPKRGDIIDGIVTATSPTAVYVDVGAKAEGVIPGRELERMSRETLDLLKPGASITVFVINPHSQDGGPLLSLNRALEELDWRRAEEYRESQEVYESHVAGYNKGGLIVRFGRLRGFVPQSQIGSDRRRLLDGETPEERWGKMVNETISVKVMEVDRARNRLILSERMAARESRESRKEDLIGRLQVGEVRTGRVVSLVDFGAFVDIGGAEGLVHLTELSWKHITHPKEFLTVGQEVKAEVISIDPENKRIGLSMKRQEVDPWDTVAINYQIGQLVQGIVTKMTKFGAFVRLVDVPEIEGLVHISELSDQRVAHPREVLQEGETVTLRVVKMDIEDRRLGLSLKKVNSAEYLDIDWG